MGSLETLRTKLAQVAQGTTESTSNFDICFNQKINENLYAVQIKYPNSVERKISFKNEKKTILEKYILNLQGDLSYKLLS